MLIGKTNVHITSLQDKQRQNKPELNRSTSFFSLKL